MEFTMYVECTPVPQPRQRHVVRMSNKKPFVHNYTPSDSPVRAYKETLAAAARKFFCQPPFTGPLRADVDFYMPRPKRLCKAKSPAGRIWCTKRIDIDNLAKATWDAMVKIVFVDDSQIVDSRCRKFYHAQNEQAHVKITVTKLSDEVLEPQEAEEVSKHDATTARAAA